MRSGAAGRHQVLPSASARLQQKQKAETPGGSVEKPARSPSQTAQSGAKAIQYLKSAASPAEVSSALPGYAPGWHGLASVFAE